MNFARIKDIAVRGQGRLDNLTLARSAHMDQFYAAANWLVKHQDDRGGWPIMVSREAGIAQWLERRTHDRKVPGSSPGRSGGRIFFSRVNFLC